MNDPEVSNNPSSNTTCAISSGIVSGSQSNINLSVVVAKATRTNSTGSLSSLTGLGSQINIKKSKENNNSKGGKLINSKRLAANTANN